MNRRLSQWGLFSGIVCVSWLAGALLLEQVGTFVAAKLLWPSFAVCQAVTPSAWQAKGNILLGLMWLVSGVVVHSMLIGAAFVVGVSVGKATTVTQTILMLAEVVSR